MISIEQDKKTQSYNLIIGPIDKKSNAKTIFNKLKKQGYQNAVVISG